MNSGTTAVRPSIVLPSERDASGRDLGAEELALLAETIRSGTLIATSGTQTRALEAEFAQAYGVPYCRAVSSGTAAVHTAVAAVDPEPGDEIVTTPITDMGAIAPILYQGAVPVFADVDPVTLNVTADALAERITDRTRAILVAHLFGAPCEMGPILAVAARAGLPVIEDCAQAYLTRYRGALVGTLGWIGTFSLQQGKHITTGEGGFVITAAEDAELHTRIRRFVDKGWGYGEENPDHFFLAPNYRMSELQGAVGRAQLAKLERNVAARRTAAARLSEALACIPGLEAPVDDPDRVHTYWRFPLRVDADEVPGGPRALAAELRAFGVASAPNYVGKPAFLCALFTERRTLGSSGWPLRRNGREVTYDASEYPGVASGLEQVLVLPWNERYRAEHVDYVAEALAISVARLRGEPA